MTFSRLLRTNAAKCVLAFATLTIGASTGHAAELKPTIATAEFISRANSLPRKVVIASAVAAFAGSVEQRLALAGNLIDEAAVAAKSTGTNGALDLVVLPEFAILRESGVTAADRRSNSGDPSWTLSAERRASIARGLLRP